jgi:TonB-linked SusC/RagA family outer membrane protein
MKKQILTLILLVTTSIAFSQNVITGGVLDDANIPVPSANVQIKDTTIGTVTDFDGNFTLSGIEMNQIIQVSYVGFKTSEIVYTGQDNITIVLEVSAEALEEVVVIGYGAQRKKEVTGAVSVLDSESIEKMNPVRVEQAIQGQIAGVNITSNSGSPGSGLNIRIRGITTNGDNRPLILVDGNRIEDLSVLNPNDIKSINVLKDATAGIYGVQGANGVILITTKTGRTSSELKFTLDTFSGFQTTSQRIDLMNAFDFAQYVNDASNSNQFLVYPREGTDWQDEVFETAIMSSVNFSATGGTEKLAYSGSVSYLTQDGIVGGGKNNFERFTARINTDYNVLDNLKITFNGLHTLSTKQNLPEGGIGAVLYNAVNMNPNATVREPNGDFTLANQISQIEIINPVAQISNTFNTTRVSRFSGVLGAEYKFWDNFKVTSRIQGNLSNVLDDVFRPEQFYGNGKSANVGDPNDDNITNEVVDFGANYYDFTWDNLIEYSNTFDDDHNLTVLLGTSLYRTWGDFYGNIGFTDVGTNQVGQTVFDPGMTIEPRFTEADLENGLDWFDSRLSSLFTRVQYDYKGKYLFSAVIRRDLSSRFSPQNNNNVGYFPSGSVGWNVSDEDFMQKADWINNFKVRASYGVIGNDRIVADFPFITRLNGQAVIDPGTGITNTSSLLFGLAGGRIGNPDLQWEEQETANFGVDLSLFDRKVSFTADAYRKETRNLLLAPQASGVTGSAAPGSGVPFVNAGTVRNQGLELALGYNDNIGDDFKFNVNVNFSTINNEVISLNGRETPVAGEFGVGLGITDITRMEPGLPLGHFFGYRTDGIYQTDAEAAAANNTLQDVFAGDLRFVDVNGDGQITPEDRTNIGDPIADYTFGLNIGFTYKNIDFSANGFGSIGNDMIRNYERADLFANRGTYMLDRWQGFGTGNTVPRAIAGANINSDNFNDFYVEDASFFRIQNVQIGYTFGEDVNEELGVTKFRIYVAGNNIHTFTDYLGYDPSANSGNPLGGAIDNGFYPVASSYLLGINLNF